MAAENQVQRRGAAAVSRTWRIATATATALSGLLAVASAVTPDVPGREAVLLAVESGGELTLGHVLAVAGGLAMLVLSWGLFRGKRRAADTTVVLLCLIAFVHVAKGLDYEESLTTLALAGLIFVGRGAFRRGGEPRAGLTAGVVLVGAVAAGYAVTIFAILVTGHSIGVAHAATRAGRALLDGSWWLRSGEPWAVALDLLMVVAIVAAGIGLRALLRPMRPAEGHTPGEYQRAVAIVRGYGDDSLAPFTLREDKALFFAHGGVIAYRTLRETAVVSGDPVGPPESLAPLLDEFRRFATERGWDIVLTGASPRYVGEFRRLGLRTLKIGNEAVVDPRRFSLEGRPIRKVRQAVHRVQRQGWDIALVSTGQMTAALTEELERVERAWQASQPRLQGFAMTIGHLWRPDRDREAVYVVARDPQGEVRSFLRFLVYRRGLSLDVMRRAEEAPNGLVEAMVVAALAHAREHDVGEVSLNFAGFAHVMAADAALTRVQRLMRWGLTRLHGRFQLERLVRFNEKFEPEWRPRYLVYQTNTRLPLAALRVLQAEAYLRSPQQARGVQVLARARRRVSLGLG